MAVANDAELFFRRERKPKTRMLGREMEDRKPRRIWRGAGASTATGLAQAPRRGWCKHRDLETLNVASWPRRTVEAAK